MPTAIELNLGPTTELGDPDQWHGLACHLVGAHAEGGRLAPISVWPTRREPELAGDATLFRVNWLDDAVPPVTRLDSGTVRLGSQRFAVRSATTTQQTYAVLAANAVAAKRVTFSFETPTYFSRRERDLPIPDPELVFASLGRRWDAFCPVGLRIGAQLGQAVCGAVVVDGMRDVNIQVAGAAHASRRRGFTGVVSFSLLTGDSAARSCFSALSAAAPYLGVGAQTTRGFGVVQRLDSDG